MPETLLLQGPSLYPETIRQYFIKAGEILNKEVERERREWWIFQQVMGETPKALEALREFLLDVTTCPLEVFNFCVAIVEEARVGQAAE